MYAGRELSTPYANTDFVSYLPKILSEHLALKDGSSQSCGIDIKTLEPGTLGYEWPSFSWKFIRILYFD